ncbi:MAG: hypothetical protein COV30_00980 [Candidatus Yanofskybacteria bacterium CG10_big_fil_rev_8_21_14_0_10_37_15]|uniref:R3H domain-containing protein n=1 Tax=Candidatus Yanofskybacteria bacterium CG10_big_fil_rev_8_21_14_0_10_37_15 TaxID=1975097 RepID=A0A2H0R5Z4_9BACT|nr:MAG: hypothetical protein COV30_00980 [Candidatus Yanofskybacteria bacterium CG10_big_fil_rev_8_21_14_0_10_37_15]
MTNLTEQNKEKIKETIKKMVGFMNLECQVELREELDLDDKINLTAAIYAPDNARFLIGRNGQNLKAFEHLARAIVMKFIKLPEDDFYQNLSNLVSGSELNKKDEKVVLISVDVNDYKRSRTTYIIDVAKQAVTRVRNTQKAEVLLPMSSFERRIVHMELASCPDIATESMGEEPRRRIIVKPYP